MRMDRLEGLENKESWNEYRRLVVQSLKDLDNDINNLRDSFNKDINNLRITFNKMELRFTKDLERLKVTTAFWGAIFGTVFGAAISALVEILLKGR